MEEERLWTSVLGAADESTSEIPLSYLVFPPPPHPPNPGSWAVVQEDLPPRATRQRPVAHGYAATIAAPRFSSGWVPQSRTASSTRQTLHLVVRQCFPSYCGGVARATPPTARPGTLGGRLWNITSPISANTAKARFIDLSASDIWTEAHEHGN